MANDLMALLMSGQGGNMAGATPQKLPKDQQQPFDEGQFHQALFNAGIQSLGQNPIDRISLWQAQDQQRRVAQNPDWYAYWNQKGGDVPPLPGDNTNRPISDQMASQWSLTGEDGKDSPWSTTPLGITSASGQMQGNPYPWLDQGWMQNAQKVYTQYGPQALSYLF